MKKVLMWLICIIAVFSIVLVSFACSSEATVEETANEDADVKVDQDSDTLDPEIAKVWASVDQFRYPIDPDFKGPNGESVTLDTESLPLTVSETDKIKEGEYTIGVSWNTLNGEYFAAWRKGTLDAAEYLNIEIVAEASAEFDAAKQLSDVESMIPLEPDVIISSPIDPVVAAGAFRPALDAGIKLAFVSNIPEGYKIGEDYIGVTTSNAHDYGVFAYEMLYELLGSGGKLAAMPWTTNYWFTTYYNSVFFDMVENSDLDLIAEEGYVTYDDAYAVANGIIMTHPEVEGIYVDYNTPGQGVINACMDAGRDDIYIVTGGYDEPTLLNLIDGHVDGIFSDVTYLVGYNAVLLAAYGMLEKEGPEYSVCPAVKLTLENVRDVWAAGMGTSLPESVDDALKEKGL